jgi:hypothetical protein
MMPGARFARAVMVTMIVVIVLGLVLSAVLFPMAFG